MFQRIQEDSDVCNNCFRRTHDTFERNFAVDTYRQGGKTQLWAREVELPERSFVRPDSIEHVPGTLASDGTHVYCECGCPEALRPVDLRTAMEHTKRLYERLDEYGADADKNILLDTVRERMRRPENQGRFDSVLKEAVQVCLNGSDDGSQ